MHSERDLIVGIDIGGTNTKYGIANGDGNILYRGELRTDQHQTIHTFIEELYEKLSPAIGDAGGNRIKGIGIGAPNGNIYTGAITNAPNLHWKGIVPAAQLIQDKFQLHTVLTNDANAAALGEMIYGGAKGMRDFIMLTLGTGVGSGIVANGQLVYGHDGFAGELGHTTIRPGGRKHWSTDIKGSLEAYCSATGIAITAKEMLAKSHIDSMLREYNTQDIDAKAVNECADEGDELAIEIYNVTGQILGEAMANFVMFSSPEAIFLFGGAMNAGEWLVKPAHEAMEANLLPVFRKKVKILPSALKEGDAAILGAAALVQHGIQH